MTPPKRPRTRCIPTHRGLLAAALVTAFCAGGLPAAAAAPEAGAAGVTPPDRIERGMMGHHGRDFPISIAEARERADARFRAVDADGDGVISRAEFDAAPLPRRHGRHPHGGQHPRHAEPGAGSGDGDAARAERRAARDAAVFAALDRDGDGHVSADEFDSHSLREARKQAIRDRLFEQLDKNGDGVLGADEAPDPTRRLAVMDTDGDGLVSRAEADAHRLLHRGRAE